MGERKELIRLVAREEREGAEVGSEAEKRPACVCLPSHVLSFRQGDNPLLSTKSPSLAALSALIVVPRFFQLFQQISGTLAE